MWFRRPHHNYAQSFAHKKEQTYSLACFSYEGLYEIMIVILVKKHDIFKRSFSNRRVRTEIARNHGYWISPFYTFCMIWHIVLSLKLKARIFTNKKKIWRCFSTYPFNLWKKSRFISCLNLFMHFFIQLKTATRTGFTQKCCYRSSRIELCSATCNKKPFWFTESYNQLIITLLQCMYGKQKMHVMLINMN